MAFGIVYATAAFTMFGITPVYYKLFGDIPAIQIALHRFMWTFPLSLCLVLLLGQVQSFKAQAFTHTNVLLYAGSGVSLGCSTILLVWAVNNGFLIEVSLGAFLNPLTLVVLGIVALNEKLRRVQLIAVSFATLGVLIFTIAYGKFPWVAILLTLGDGIYSMFKRVGKLTPLHGLALESGILFPVCVTGVLIQEYFGIGVMGHTTVLTDVLLVGTGVVTIVPLLLLVAATQTTPFYAMGLLSNLTPTIQFILGVAVYNEEFSTVKLVGFCFLWMSLVVFIVDSFFQSRMEKQIPRKESLTELELEDSSADFSQASPGLEAA